VSRSSARYEPSWPVIPVMRAVRIRSRAAVEGWDGHEKGSPRELPLGGEGGDRGASRHLHAARRTGHLARVEAARADLHLRDLAVDQGADDLQVGLPRATRLVVRVRDVVAERDALVAVVAAVALDGHGWLLPDELDDGHVRAVALAV